MIGWLRVTALVAVMAAGVAGRALAQNHPMGEVRGEHAEHEAMAARHEAMMAEMEAANARLEQLASALRAAEGDERIDAMAALVLELAAQRQGMCHHMMESMHGAMMGGHEEHEKPEGGRP
jgi:hypothetical protein